MIDWLNTAVNRAVASSTWDWFSTTHVLDWWSVKDGLIQKLGEVGEREQLKDPNCEVFSAVTFKKHNERHRPWILHGEICPLVYPQSNPFPHRNPRIPGFLPCENCYSRPFWVVYVLLQKVEKVFSIDFVGKIIVSQFSFQKNFSCWIVSFCVLCNFNSKLYNIFHTHLQDRPDDTSSFSRLEHLLHVQQKLARVIYSRKLLPLMRLLNVP